MNKWTEERLAAAEERCAKATPGPWEADEQRGTDTIWIDVTVEEAISGGGHLGDYEICNTPPLYKHEPEGKAYQQQTANVAFIAHARTDLPDALEEIRKLNEYITRLQTGINAEMERLFPGLGVSATFEERP